VLFVFTYILEGSTVIKTDVIQTVVILALMATVFFIPLKSEDVLEFNTFFTGGSMIFTMFILGMIMPFCSADYYQKIFAAKDIKTVRLGIPLVGPLSFVMTVSLVFFGMSAKNFLPSDTIMDNVIFDIFKTGILSSWILVVLTLVIISMAMSTIDSQSYVFSSTLLEDFKKIDIVKEKKKYIKYSRVAVAFLLAMSIVISLHVENFIQYLFSIASLSAITCPVFVGASMGLFPSNDKMDKMIALSLLISTTVFFVLLIVTKYSSFPLTLIPVAVSFALVGIAWFICREKKIPAEVPQTEL